MNWSLLVIRMFISKHMFYFNRARKDRDNCLAELDWLRVFALDYAECDGL